MKKKKSRTIKSPDWHVEQALYHRRKEIDHLLASGLIDEGSEFMKNLQLGRVVISDILNRELKRMNDVKD